MRAKSNPNIILTRVKFLLATFLLTAISLTFAGFAGCADPVPPSADPVRLVVWAGTDVTPEDFVFDVKGTDVTLSFTDGMPDTNETGSKNVNIKLLDRNGNISIVNSLLCVYRPISSKTIEIDTDLGALSPLDFIEGAVEDPDVFRFTLFTGVDSVGVSLIGKHDVYILLDGIAAKQTITLEIVDVIPPEASPVFLERWTNDELDPHDFVTDIIDQTHVMVDFYEEPNLSVEGEQEVQILLTDESGNETIITSGLAFKRDTEPPVLTGEFDKSVCIGEVILYRAGISVTDNRDEDVPLAVNSDAVNANVPGTYPVIYSATDSSGNTTTVEGSLVVYDVPIDEVNEMIDEIIKDIIKQDMTDRQKARAIFDYVRFKIVYGTNQIKDNVHYAAYRALKSGVGDCYSSYALCELLLTRAGIENMPIKRVPGYPTRHFWSLVNVGDGWYHFDTTQMTATDRGFLFNDKDAEDFTAAMVHIVPGYYVYDKSLYPEVGP